MATLAAVLKTIAKAVVQAAKIIAKKALADFLNKKDEDGNSNLKKILIVALIIVGIVVFLFVGIIFLTVAIGPLSSILNFFGIGYKLPCETIETPWIAEFPLPTYQMVTSNHYGAGTQFYASHSGVDFAVPEETEVCSIYDGKVVSIGHADKAFGNWVLVYHQVWRLKKVIDADEEVDLSEFEGEEVRVEEIDGKKKIWVLEKFYSFYAHLEKIIAVRGQTVITQQVIGLSGGDPKRWYSGNSTGPHLHFEIRDKFGVPKNPIDYIGVG